MTTTHNRHNGGNGDARSLADAALRLARFAPVLPLVERGKTPLISGGVHNSSQDPATVRGWWLRWPTANVGLAMGVSAWALDVDGQEGLDTLSELEDLRGWLPETVASVTGSGGMHLLFRADERVKNSVRKLGAGLDTRAAGGYVVSPPSVHPNGNAYCWLTSRDPWSTRLEPAPAWLLDLAAPPEPETRALVIRKPPEKAHTPYIEAALRGELQRVATAGKGARNHALFRAAASLGRFVADGDLDARHIGPALADVAMSTGLSRQEAERTIVSALKTAVRGGAR